ncbi:MAG: hypothetical protein QMD10_13140 [Desulfitobacteriaceae bacterium]|nr:hypothetical protein [Desulfitobacteriaceae bacterium]
MRYSEADCGLCANQKTHWCERCIHNEDLDDYYQPADSEQIRAILEGELIDERVEVCLSGEFLKVYAAAKKFTSNNVKLFMPVHAGNNCLTATDGYALARFPCDVPSLLEGKNIVCIKNGTVMVHSKTLPWQDKKIEELVDAKKSAFLSDLPEPARKKHLSYGPVVYLSLQDATVTIREKH